MGEEEKKSEEAKPEEEKKGEAPPAEEKPAEEKKAEEKDAPPPPPPPQEIVLKVYMHCEGCARKVKRCLKGFQGVEDVMTDCKSHEVVVKGEKADPLKVLERVQRKSHRQVQLLSPIPKPPSEEDAKKEKEKEKPKPEEKKEEPPAVITVVLRVHMHCEACAQEIRKRIQRMKGVESAEPDLKASEVAVKGVFEAAKLVEYVYKRTGKHAAIVRQDPPPPEKKEEDDKGKDGKEEKKAAGDGGAAAADDDKKPAAEGDAKGEKEGGVAPAEVVVEAAAPAPAPVVDVKKSEYYYQYHLPPVYAREMSSYPPQIFSDENPNACTVM